jgi:hypothetical protein
MFSESNVVLVVRGTVEAAIAEIRARLGGDLEVRKTFMRDNEVIVWVEAPLGHTPHRWYNEPETSLIWFQYSDGNAPS